MILVTIVKECLRATAIIAAVMVAVFSIVLAAIRLLG